MSVSSLVGIRRKRQKKLIEVVAIAIVVVIALMMPLLLSSFRLKLLGRFLALAIAALGIDLIWGYTGILSLGHGIFFALGGYGIAMHLNLQQEGLPDFFSLYGVQELPWFWQPFYSFPVTVIAIFTVPAIIAGLLGYLVFRNRIKGVYFSILTQAALLVFFNFFNGQQKLINGTNGLKTDTQRIFGQLASSDGVQLAFYITTVVFLLLTYFLCRWLVEGRFGHILIAIRDDETRMRFSGYDPTQFKVLVFALSGAIAALAGALYTVQTGIITPNAMEVAFSIEMVIWVAVGGRGTLIGAILGTLIVRYGQTFLSEQYSQFWQFFQGGLFLIVVTVLPNGIVGWIRDEGMVKGRALLGLSPRLSTYPAAETNPEAIAEAKEIQTRNPDIVEKR